MPNKQYKKIALSASVPIMIIGMVIGYMILYVTQVEGVYEAERQNIQASINLHKSIMLLQQLDRLEKIASARVGGQNRMELGITESELRYYVESNLRAVSQYLRQYRESSQAKELDGIKKNIAGLFNDDVKKLDVDARQKKYERIIVSLQRLDAHKSGDGKNINRGADAAETLLDAYAQSTIEIMESVVRLRTLLSNKNMPDTGSLKAKGEVYKTMGVLESAHAGLKQQFALLKNKFSGEPSLWVQATDFENKLTQLEGIVNSIYVHRNKQGLHEIYLAMTAKVTQAGLNVYERVAEKHVSVDMLRLQTVAANRSELRKIGLVIIAGVLVLSVIYLLRNAKTVKKLKSVNLSLARSENNIRNIIELLPYTVVLHDANHGILMANRAFLDLYKSITKTHAPLPPNLKDCGEVIYKLIHADIERLKSGELLSTRKEIFVAGDGEKKVMHVSSIPYPINDKRSSILTVMLDMTEIYKIRELQKISGVGYWEWNLSDNKFNFPDKFFETIGIEGGTETGNFDLYLEAVVPEDRQRVEKEFANVYKTQQAIDIEHRVRKSSGEVSVVHIKGRIYQRDGNESTHMAGTVQDITGRKRAEEALKLSEMKYRKLVENLSEQYFFYSYDLNGEVSYISPSVATMLGYTNEELLKSEIIHAMINSGPLRGNARAVHGSFDERAMHRDIAVMNRSNKIRHLELSEVPVYSFSHELVGFDGIAHDVTNNKLRESELRESEKRLRQLAVHLQDVRENERASIARDIHDEIGGYLMALKMDISLLNKRLDKADTRIHSRFQSMSQLIDVAIEATRRMITNLRPSILDELGLIEALEWQLNAFSERYEVDVEFNYDCRIAGIEFTDPEYSVNIFRIFQEILNNISKHAEARSVTVFVVVHANIFALSVSDDGVGIKNDEFNKAGSYGILGMQERIKNMDGLLHIYGCQGKGSTVMIRLPLDEEKLTGAPGVADISFDEEQMMTAKNLSR
jgi:PAS domain S-box-containing protein